MVIVRTFVPQKETGGLTIGAIRTAYIFIAPFIRRLNRNWNVQVTTPVLTVARDAAKSIEIENVGELKSKCLRLLNIPEFKDAKLVRLDDWYVHEINKKAKADSGYWITTTVKTDKDGDTIIVVYVGHKDSNEKAQFFIKPEKGQLTSDHKDMDPAKILSSIEVHFKGRTLTQIFED